MKFLFLLMIKVKLVFSRLTNEIIIDSNKTVFTDLHLETSIVNPFFGQVFSHRMLENLRMFYYSIKPLYTNDINRDYSKDKHTDCLSKFLIRLFPSPGGNLATTTQGISNISRKYFGNDKFRSISIKIFAKLFVNILKLENNKSIYKLEDHEYSKYNKKKYKELLYKLSLAKKDIIEFKKNKENLILVLLTIHSFMLDVLNTKEEYKLYVTTILKHVSRSDITEVIEYAMKDLTFIDEENYDNKNMKCDTLNENSKVKVGKKILNLIYDCKRDIYPYRKDNPPVSNILIPFYNRAENKYDKIKKFPDCVDITILHLCNILFYSEKKKIFDLEHLMLDKDSNLLSFYKKYNTPFVITYEVRKDWAKVIQCLDDIPCKSKHNKNIGKIFYIKKIEKNEIKSCLMNIVTVLCRISISETNNIFKNYVKLFDCELKPSKFVNSFVTILKLLVNKDTKIICTGENLKRDKNFLYGLMNLQLEDKIQASKTKMQFNVLENHSFATLLERKSKYINDQNINICIASGSILSPLDYLLFGYIKSISETNNQKYEASMLDKMFNTQQLISNEIKRNHLLSLYNLLNESEFDTKIYETSEMIVKSTPLNDFATFNLFIPFMIKIDSLKKTVDNPLVKLKTWASLLNLNSFEHENSKILKIWDDEITQTDLSNQAISFIDSSTQKLLYGLNILTKTNINKLLIAELKDEKFDWKKISNIIKKIKSLEKLTLELKRCDSKDLECIKEIFTSKENNILHLKLLNNCKKLKFLEILSEALCDKNNKIKHLDISENNLQPNDGILIRNILQHENNKVTHLDLDFNDLGIIGTEYICEALKFQNNKITYLDLSDNEIYTEGAKLLSEALLHKYNNITSLSLKYNNIKDEGIEYICNALICMNTKIKSLELSDNKIRDTGVNSICNLIRSENNNLKDLSLDNCNITSKGIKLLSDVLINSKNQIVSLSIAKNKLKEVGAKYISDILKSKNNNIEELDISRNNISDLGVKYISDALKNENNKLVNLNLASNKINPKGVKSICSALQNKNNKLNVLNLDRNNIQPEGANYIKESLLSKFNVLDKIYLNNCNLGVQGYNIILETFYIKRNKMILILVNDANLKTDKYKHHFLLVKTDSSISHIFFQKMNLKSNFNETKDFLGKYNQTIDQ